MVKRNLFSKLADESNSLFKNESVLQPEFLPDVLPHRDTQINTVATALRPIIDGRRPQNISVIGRPGTGKTSCVKYVLRELDSYSDRVLPVYINCFEYNTRHSILSKITISMGYPVSRRGIATDEVYDKFLEMLKKSGKIPILVLDEVDQILSKPDGMKLLYDLLRIHEWGAGFVGLITISNVLSLGKSADARVYSSLREEDVEFERYTPNELKDILLERSEYAFMPGCLEGDVIPLCAAHGAKNGGDARISIETLWKSGRVAERENSQKVLLEHVRKAINDLSSKKVSKIIENLSPEEKTILSLLSKGEKTTSGKLYKRYLETSKTPVAERTFRNYVSRLESMGLIEAPRSGKGIRGNTKVVSLKVPLQSVSINLNEVEAKKEGEKNA
ncbi:MAG: AAA family ATPase [Candidatus Diapherotrites archaeon]|nr:AAA family ATPase [Candidatus Diapherotrites archaeon]